MLAGCMRPRQEAPFASSPITVANWRDESGAGVTAPTVEWWAAFNDPMLSTIVTRTLEANLDLAIAASRIEEARAQLNFAKGQQGPQLDASIGGGPQRALDPFGRPLNQTVGQAALAVAYDTDLFGRLSNATASARATLLSNEAARDNVRLALAATAASSYLTLRSLDARVAVLRATVRSREEALGRINRRAAAGYAPALDLRQAEADLKAAQALIPSTELAIRRQEHGLSILMGGRPNSVERGIAWDAIRLPEVAVGIPSAVLRRRPDIYQAELQLVAADRTLDSARAAFLPTLRLSATGGAIAATRLPDPVSIFSLGGSILAPLFASGRLRAQADAATARRDQAALAYRRATLTALREVEDALAAVDRYAEQERRITDQRVALKEVLRVATNRYRVGYSPYLEQLDAQRTLLATELALVQVRSDRMIAHISLFQALGGGWSQNPQ
jgi:NodT family efflux transporter outer membrane factor (OMF) lipoprotein